MFPNNVEEWMSVSKVINKDKTLPEKFEDCWNNARKPVEELEIKIQDLEREIEEIREETCPYDHCYYADAEDLDSDLSDANQKLDKCSELRKEFNDILERMQDCDNFSEFKDDITKDFEVLCAKFDDISLYT